MRRFEQHTACFGSGLGMLRVWLLLCCAMMGVQGISQDLLFNNYLGAAIYANPALAGTGLDTVNKDGGRMASLYRNQWSLPGHSPYNSNYFGYDQKINDAFGNWGTYLIYDAAGKDGALRTMQWNAVYAYEVPLVRDKWNARFGMSMGYKSISLRNERLVYEDQVDWTRGVVLETSEPTENVNRSNLDITVGGLLYAQKGYAGLSIHNVQRPEFNYLGTVENRVSRRFAWMLGYRIPLGKSQQVGVSVALNKQGVNSQWNVGIALESSPLTLGVGWRSSLNPMFRSDAAVFSVRYTVKNLKVFYGFEYTLSGLNIYAPTSHELGISLPFTLNPYFREYPRSRNPLKFDF